MATTPSRETPSPSTAVAETSSSEIIEKCKRDMSALCSSVVQLRLQDRASIDLLQRDTDWMHSLSILALLFRVGLGLSTQSLDGPGAVPSGTFEGLVAEVRRLAERCDLLEGRQSGSDQSAPLAQSSTSQQPPTYEEIGGDPISAFVTPQETVTAQPMAIQSVPSSSASTFHSQPSGWTHFYIHTRINPPFITPNPNQRSQIRSIVDPRGVGMRLLDLPRFHLLNTGEIIICLEDEEAATRAKNRLTKKLLPILRKTYIVRWPGAPIPYLVFKVTSMVTNPSTTPAFRQMLHDYGGARKQFLATKIMEVFPILRANTGDRPDEEKFLADVETLVLVLEGSTLSFAQDFASMNPKVGIEGISLAISASVASDVPDWRNNLVDWNSA